MSAMANVTPIIATVKNASVKEKTLKETDAVPKASILDFCEEHYEDILPIILDRSGPSRASSRDPSHSRGRSLSRDRHRIGDRLRGIEESYDDTYSSHGTETKYSDLSRDRNHSRGVKRWRERVARIWFDELPPESIDGYKNLKAAFLAYFMLQKKYVKDPVEIYNIKQRDGETIEEFMKRFKIETGCMKGATEFMQISGFMHGVNNLELKKCINKHIPKYVEEMMTATTAFIRGETTNAKEIFAAELGKFKPSPPMIGELVRAGKLSHFIKEIRKDRNQSKRLENGRYSQRQNCNHLYDMAVAESDATEEAEIGGHAGHRMYVDGGSSIEVLYEHCFNWIRPKIKSQMAPATTSLTGFSEETIWPLGQLRFLVTIGDAEHYKKAWMNFMIVRSPSPYNGIIRRPGIREIQEVPSTAHGMLKFSVNGRIETIRSTILTPTECATIAVTPKDSTKKAEARHKNFKPSDMMRVPRSIVEHRLNIREGYSPVRQKKKGFLPPSKNRLEVESLYGYPFKCFLDTYKGYHQIQMAKQDEEKTAFRTSYGVYCYTKIPFGLKNVDATYQRLVDKAFDRQIGQNLEIYVDDLVIKSHTKTELIRDIEETLRTLRKINMKLNPKKYTFGAAEGMFLGYMISLKGIKPCPDKTEAVLQLLSLWTIKEVQSLNEKLASLNRFLSKSTKKSLPLFKTLKKCIKKDTGLFRKPSTVSSQAKLYPNGKASPGASLRSQKFTQILSGASHCGYHRPAHQARQILAEFLVQKPYDAPPEASVIETLQEPWTLFTDRSSCVDGSGVGLILTSPEGKEFTYTLRFQFIASNNEAEYEALIAGLRIAVQMEVFVDVLKEKSIQEMKMATVVEEEGPTWMTHSFLKPWLRCVEPLQADYVIREIHEGLCSMHAGPRSVVAKAIRYGYYWPTMHRDAREMIHKCKDCQIHRPVPRHPQQPLTPITAPWPFYKEIVSDNSKQFSNDPFKDWCEKLNIIQRFASVKHPQSNGLVERANKSLGEGIKAHLVDVVHNDKELRLNLDLLEERRERTAIRESKAKLNMTKYYNARVRGVTFRPGDFVYRSNDASYAVNGGKLGPKWEGPYEVTEELGDGAYKLRSTDGTVLSRTWNIANLKKCYL
nr:reverse transcriptase domain-containing protein [Tanacetum cinerariifolium]